MSVRISSTRSCGLIRVRQIGGDGTKPTRGEWQGGASAFGGATSSRRSSFVRWWRPLSNRRERRSVASAVYVGFHLAYSRRAGTVCASGRHLPLPAAPAGPDAGAEARPRCAWANDLLRTRPARSPGDELLREPGTIRGRLRRKQRGDDEAGEPPGALPRRNTPSVLYLGFVRRFHFHWEVRRPLPDAPGGLRRRPTTRGARHEAKPLLNPDEMGNRDRRPSRTAVAGQQRHGRDPGAPRRRRTPRSPRSGERPRRLLERREMSPFSSKYDDYVAGFHPTWPKRAASRFSKIHPRAPAAPVTS